MGVIIFTMDELQQFLTGFFCDIARRDRQLVEQIRQQPVFQLDDGQWQFTLPDLYQFILQLDRSSINIDYTTFRSALYNSPVNQNLEPLGAKIIIVRNRENVNESTYALAWL